MLVLFLYMYVWSPYTDVSVFPYKLILCNYWCQVYFDIIVSVVTLKGCVIVGFATNPVTIYGVVVVGPHQLIETL